MISTDAIGLINGLIESLIHRTVINRFSRFFQIFSRIFSQNTKFCKGLLLILGMQGNRGLDYRDLASFNPVHPTIA
jgi:hypothetical protein